MTHRPALLLASTALLVAAISGGLAIHEAGKAKDAALLAPAAQIAEMHRIINEIRDQRDAAFPTEIERRIAALEALRTEITTLRPAAAIVETVARQMADLEARLTILASGTTDTVGEIAQAEIQRLRTQIAEIRAYSDAAANVAVEALRGEIASLRQSAATAQAVETISRLLEEIQSQMVTLAAATPEARAAMAEIVRRIEALETMPRPPMPTLESLLADASPAARDALGRLGLAATLANPQQVIEAITAFVQEQRRLEAQGRPLPSALLTETFTPGSGALRAGPAGAARRVAILTDHNCPFCRRAMPLVRQLLDQGDVEIVIHEMPVLSPQSREAALVATAAARIDQRRALHLYLAVGTHEGRLDEAAMLEKAAGLGFDREVLQREMERAETRQTVDRSLDLARRLGVTGTPAFVVQDLLIQGLQPDQVLQALSRPR